MEDQLLRLDLGIKTKSQSLQFGWCRFGAFSNQVLKLGLPEETESLQPESFNAPPPLLEEWLAWRDIWWSYQDFSERSHSPGEFLSFTV